MAFLIIISNTTSANSILFISRNKIRFLIWITLLLSWSINLSFLALGLPDLELSTALSPFDAQLSVDNLGPLLASTWWTRSRVTGYTFNFLRNVLT